MPGIPGAGGFASLFSLAGAGFQFGASMLQAQGEKIAAQGRATGYQYEAEKADVNAQYGELKAAQVSGQLTRNLNMTLGNIDAIRAAARTDVTSPTGAAVRNTMEAAGMEQKGIEVGNILAQAEQSKADAAYYRQAATTALLAGKTAAEGDIMGGIGKAVGALAA